MTARHDVFEPKDKHPEQDPKASIEKERDEADSWKQRKEAARAKREFEDEERTARRARELEENPPESPFQIKGSLNLGNFDMQKQNEELRVITTKIAEDAKNQIAELRVDNRHYQDEVNKIQREMSENTFKAHIQQLERRLDDGFAKPQDQGILAEIDNISKVAAVLGFSKAAESSSDPPQIRLAILKMEMDGKQAARQFEWDKMMSERNWQLELKKLEIENVRAVSQVQIEKEKRGMWASPFESIGVAIARGLMDSGGGGEPNAPPATKGKRSEHKLQAGENDSGTVECPECNEPIAIAPKARSAVCPSCEATISINRIKEPNVTS